MCMHVLFFFSSSFCIFFNRLGNQVDRDVLALMWTSLLNLPGVRKTHSESNVTAASLHVTYKPGCFASYRVVSHLPDVDSFPLTTLMTLLTRLVNILFGLLYPYVSY